MLRNGFGAGADGGSRQACCGSLASDGCAVGGEWEPGTPPRGRQPRDAKHGREARSPCSTNHNPLLPPSVLHQRPYSTTPWPHLRPASHPFPFWPSLPLSLNPLWLDSICFLPLPRLSQAGCAGLLTWDISSCFYFHAGRTRWSPTFPRALSLPHFFYFPLSRNFSQLTSPLPSGRSTESGSDGTKCRQTDVSVVTTPPPSLQLLVRFTVVL